MMKVSVVTVVFNARDVIDETILSVLRQTYDDVEYIVIDGGSTDGTVEIISRHRDRMAHFVSEKDGGIYDALNKGVRAATGEWIGIMNAGDVFSSDDVLARVFGNGASYEGVDVIYGDSREIDGDRVVNYTAKGPITTLAHDFLYRHGASFVRRTTHLKYLFDLSLKSRLGYALDLWQIRSMYKGGCIFRYAELPIVDFEREGASAHPWKSLYYNYLIAHDLKWGLGERLGFCGVVLKSFLRRFARRLRRCSYA